MKIKKSVKISIIAFSFISVSLLTAFVCGVFKSEKEKLTANIEKSVTQKVKENPIFKNVDSVVVLSIDTITQKKDLELRFWTIEKEISKMSALLKEDIKLINLELTQAGMYREMGIGGSFREYQKNQILEHRESIKKQASDYKETISILDSINKSITLADSVKPLYLLVRVKIAIKDVAPYETMYNINQRGYILN